MFAAAGADGHVAKLGVTEGFMGTDKMGWEGKRKGPGLSAGADVGLNMKEGPALGFSFSSTLVFPQQSVRSRVGRCLD